MHPVLRGIMKKYYFAKGSPFDPKDAQKVGEYLERYFPNSNFKPEQIVEIARPPTSPIHKYFDWDDETAAKKYRLQQARRIVNALYISIENVETRAFESVYLKAIDETSYMNSETIFNSKDLWLQVVDAAKRELLYWEAKYSLYKQQLPEIFQAIERLKEREKKHEKESVGRNRRTNSYSANRNKGGANYIKRDNTASGKQIRRKVEDRNARKTNERRKEG